MEKSNKKTVLEVKSLTKSYAENIIIKNLNFTIFEGEKIAIFAPSGSGKTTLLNIILGLDKNFKGEFHINSSYSAVFQEPRLFPYMTVLENILFSLRLKKIDITNEILEMLEKWLEVTGLKDYEKYYPYQISGGTKAKVALIRAFIVKPEIVLMDEPFKSIDIKSKQKIIKFILDNYPTNTLILVTHNIDELPLIGGKILKFFSSPLEKYDEIFIDSNSDISDILSKLF